MTQQHTLDSHKLLPFEKMIWDLVHSRDSQIICRMKQAVWLYLSLLLQAHPKTGRVDLDTAVTAETMGMKEPTIRSWLGHLRKGGFIGLKRDHGHLFVTVSKWRPSGISRTEDREDEHGSSRSRASVNRADRSRANRHEGQSMSQEQAVERAYAAALATALGDQENTSDYEELVSMYPRENLASAVEHALAVPADRIKKSRAALFRYLLKKQKNSQK